MKKILLPIITLITMVFSASAVTYMRVYTSDGQTVRYDVENITLVDYEDGIAITDTAKSDTTGTAAQGVSVSGKVGDYTYVDLGLPSGTKWATYDVSFKYQSGNFAYFSWGETSSRKDYWDWAGYKWCNGYENTLTKYCVDSNNGTVDGLTTLLAEDDAATANWGAVWRMPTATEQQELIDGCNWKWTDNFNGTGKRGQMGTSKINGNTIFLPVNQFFEGFGYDDFIPKNGYFWSSSLKENVSTGAYVLSFNEDGLSVRDGYLERYCGVKVRAVAVTHSARAVTYMRVHTNDGQTVKYDTGNVILVSYEEADSTNQGVTVSGKVGGYTYVDLGLKSGMKWATYNVGASTPTEYGDYFAWGETEPKENYDWSTYKWSDGSSGKSSSLTKYCRTDDLGTLLAEDDAATTNWGTDWRMPTKAEQKEMINGCYWKWTDDFNGSGVAGRVGTSKTNGNIIFLPATGNRIGARLSSAGACVGLWASSISDSNYTAAYTLSASYDVISDVVEVQGEGRSFGSCVRAVVK